MIAAPKRHAGSTAHSSRSALRDKSACTPPKGILGGSNTQCRVAQLYTALDEAPASCLAAFAQPNRQRPPTYVLSTRAAALPGCPLSTAKSASFPAATLPRSRSSPAAAAPAQVCAASAWAGVSASEGAHGASPLPGAARCTAACSTPGVQGPGDGGGQRLQAASCWGDKMTTCNARSHRPSGRRTTPSVCKATPVRSPADASAPRKPTCKRVQRHHRPVAAKRRQHARAQQRPKGVRAPCPRALGTQPAQQHRPVCQQVLRVWCDCHASCRQGRCCPRPVYMLGMLYAVRRAVEPPPRAPSPTLAATASSAAVASAAAGGAAGSAALGAVVCCQLSVYGKHFVHSSVPDCVHRHLQASQPVEAWCSGWGVRGLGPGADMPMACCAALPASPFQQSPLTRRVPGNSRPATAVRLHLSCPPAALLRQHQPPVAAACRAQSCACRCCRAGRHRAGGTARCDCPGCRLQQPAGWQ